MLHTHSQTCTHRHAHAHTDPHTQTRTCTHTAKETQPATLQVASAAQSCLPLPRPSLVHTSFFTGLLLCTHWVCGPATGRHLLVTLKCQPHPVELQAPGLVTSTKGRAGRQEGWRGRTCVSQQAGSKRPLLAGSRLSHLAEQRQWWLPGGPASFPQAKPWVLECPVNSPAGTQPKGAQGGFPGRWQGPLGASWGREGVPE